MEIHHLEENYYVGAQLKPEYMTALGASGIARVICNRPDREVPPTLQAAAIRAAVQAAGKEFFTLPITLNSLTADVAAQQAELVAKANGAVLAYCTSGTRSAVIWALGQAKTRPADEILNVLATAGFDLETLRMVLTRLYNSSDTPHD